MKSVKEVCEGRQTVVVVFAVYIVVVVVYVVHVGVLSVTRVQGVGDNKNGY